MANIPIFYIKKNYLLYFEAAAKEDPPQKGTLTPKARRYQISLNFPRMGFYAIFSVSPFSRTCKARKASSLSRLSASR